MRTKEIVENWYRPGKHARNLFEATLIPEVAKALKDWNRGTHNKGVLVGGIAMSYHAVPRYTADLDVVYLNDDDIPRQVPGFKRTRAHSFQHNETHVELEVLTPSFLKIPEGLVDLVIQNHIDFSGVPIADASGLTALKLQRSSMQDLADIQSLIGTGEVNLDPYLEYLTDKQLSNFEKVKDE